MPQNAGFYGPQPGLGVVGDVTVRIVGSLTTRFLLRSGAETRPAFGPPVSGDACVALGQRFCVLQRQSGASPAANQDAGLICASILSGHHAERYDVLSHLLTVRSGTLLNCRAQRPLPASYVSGFAAKFAQIARLTPSAEYHNMVVCSQPRMPRRRLRPAGASVGRLQRTQ